MRLLIAEDKKIDTKDRERHGPLDSLGPAIKRETGALQKHIQGLTHV